MKYVVLGLALSLCGCGDDSQSTGGTGGIGGIGGVGGAAGTGGTGGTFVDVSGTATINSVTDIGEFAGPIDLTTTAPRAIADEQVIDGAGMANGTFTIPHVPASALIQYGTTYIQLGPQPMDLGRDQLGRANAVYPTMSGTSLVLDLSGMAPWATGDDLQLISSNSGTFGFLLSNAINPPAPTATSLANFTVDWATLDGNNALIDSMRGDQTFITQLVMHQSSTGLPYSSADKTFTPTALTQMDGQVTNVTGAFGNGSADSVTLDWRRSAFEALRMSVNPNATAFFQGLSLDVEPGGLGHGVYSGTVDVVVIRPAIGATDLDYGTVSFVSPFPTTWGLFGFVQHLWGVSYMLPGTTQAASIFAGTSVTTDRASFAAGPIRPTISPPTLPRINGMDAFMEQTGVTLRPRISWSAPATGTASNYSIIVYELTASGNQTQYRPVARFYAAGGGGGSLRMPPGVLTMNATYVFEVQAVAMPGVNLVQKPFRVAMPMGIASTLSSMVTP